MKKFTLFTLCIVANYFTATAQNKTISKSIIDPSAAVTKFHEKSELESMQKGNLVDLYIERIDVIVNKIPYIALTNKRGITISDVGIPDTVENTKLLEKQKQTIRTFMSETESFERELTPFADKPDIIEAILFYESILKELRVLRN